jgi:alpha-glucosidase (family GH31 glycosyl hydrolase)
VKAGAHGRLVYLPAGSWLKVTGNERGLSGERIQPSGDTYIDATINELPLFVKLGSLIPMTDPAPHTGAESRTKYRLLGFTDCSAQCEVLLDDGETKYDSWESYPKLICSITKSNGKWATDIRFEGTAPRPLSLELELWSSDGSRQLLNVTV